MLSSYLYYTTNPTICQGFGDVFLIKNYTKFAKNIKNRKILCSEHIVNREFQLELNIMYIMLHSKLSKIEEKRRIL